MGNRFNQADPVFGPDAMSFKIRNIVVPPMLITAALTATMNAAPDGTEQPPRKWTCRFQLPDERRRAGRQNKANARRTTPPAVRLCGYDRRKEMYEQ
jgi:hypothetical protein